jgi:hypothetical protein
VGQVVPFGRICTAVLKDNPVAFEYLVLAPGWGASESAAPGQDGGPVCRVR